MKLEPVVLLYQHDETGRTTVVDPGQNTIQWEKDNPRWRFVHALYAIPEGYVVVPVEPTEEWIANMRKGTIEPQGMDAQAKIIEGLRRNYKRWIAAAKDGAANVAAHTRKPVVNGYLLEACPKCGCFGSESPCAVCKLRAASPKE